MTVFAADQDLARRAVSDRPREDRQLNLEWREL